MGKSHIKWCCAFLSVIAFTSLVAKADDDGGSKLDDSKSDYLGCYFDMDVRDINGSAAVLTTENSIEACASMCSKFAYFGLESS